MRDGVAVQSGISTGTSAKTLMQLVAAANHAIELTELTIGFHGVNNTHEPIKVEILRQTTAGTMSSLTPVKADDSVADTLDTTAQHTATVEPTAGDIVRVFTIHPQTGLTWQPSDKAPVIIGASDRLGVRTTAPNDVVADVSMAFRE